jgi:hypothetical protein
MCWPTEAARPAWMPVSPCGPHRVAATDDTVRPDVVLVVEGRRLVLRRRIRDVPNRPLRIGEAAVHGPGRREAAELGLTTLASNGPRYPRFPRHSPGSAGMVGGLFPR